MHSNVQKIRFLLCAYQASRMGNKVKRKGTSISDGNTPSGGFELVARVDMRIGDPDIQDSARSEGHG